MKHVKLFAILLTFGLLLSIGCSSGGDQPPASDVGYEDDYYDEQDSQSQAEGGSDWSGESGSLPPVHDTSPTPTNDWEQPPATPSGIMGYRVQIAAMSTKDAAMTAAREAADALNVKGYVELAGGLWKVRMGNARTRGEAEVLRDYARNRGYNDAWIVETEIVSE